MNQTHLKNPFLVIVITKVQIIVVVAAATSVIVVAIFPVVDVVPVPTQGRRPARRPLFLAPAAPGIVVRPPVVPSSVPPPVLPVRVHVLATVAVSAAVLAEAQGIVLPSSVVAGADRDVMRPLEARGLEADVNLRL